MIIVSIHMLSSKVKSSSQMNNGLMVWSNRAKTFHRRHRGIAQVSYCGGGGGGGCGFVLELCINIHDISCSRVCVSIIDMYCYFAKIRALYQSCLLLYIFRYMDIFF